jgi:hypothetical protein
MRNHINGTMTEKQEENRKAHNARNDPTKLKNVELLKEMEELTKKRRSLYNQFDKVTQ